jgi:hypothetical protein
MNADGIGAFAIGLAVVAESSCAMSTPVTATYRCNVVSGEDRLDAAGGPQALCRAVQRAAAAMRLGQSFTVQVRVQPRSMFLAQVTLANGRRLPAVHMVEMDRAITKDTLDRFGLAIVEHVASADDPLR